MLPLRKHPICGRQAVEHRLATATLSLAPGDAYWVFSPFAHIKSTIQNLKKSLSISFLIRRHGILYL